MIDILSRLNCIPLQEIQNIHRVYRDTINPHLSDIGFTLSWDEFQRMVAPGPMKQRNTMIEKRQDFITQLFHHFQHPERRLDDDGPHQRPLVDVFQVSLIYMISPSESRH